jgi:hypothetical protein
MAATDIVKKKEKKGKLVFVALLALRSRLQQQGCRFEKRFCGTTSQPSLAALATGRTVS